MLFACLFLKQASTLSNCYTYTHVYIVLQLFTPEAPLPATPDHVSAGSICNTVCIMKYNK